MEGSPPKSSRKVRFSLPESNVPAAPASAAPAALKQRVAHGTLQYVNGTLVSQASTPGPNAPGIGTSGVSLTGQPVQPKDLRPPKELSNKIVLHLRPSTAIERYESVELPGPGPKAHTDKPLKKSLPGKGGPGGRELRSFKTLPQINQKFPSTEDVNNNSNGNGNQNATPVGAGHRQKASDEQSKSSPDNNNNNNNGNTGGNLSTSKKPTVLLRNVSSSGTAGPGQKLFGAGRARSRPPVKPSGGGPMPAGKTNRTLISANLQPADGGVLIRIQDNVSARCEQPAGTKADGVATGRTAPYGKGQFLTVPEFSDRYEGMETAVSATLADEDEEEEEEEDEEEVAEALVAEEDRRKPGPELGTGGYKPTANKTGVVGDLLDDASFKCIQDTNLSRDKNSVQFWDFVERWRTNRALKKLESSGVEQCGVVVGGGGGGGSAGATGGTVIVGSTSVSIGGSFKSDAKSPTLSSRIRALRMSLEQVPTVTTLLRASRDANEYLLKEVFRDILENGISKDSLNSTDRSGRTAMSYICSTNLTNFLELFLQLPGIDVNKPDNEGNTPLHFAAQAGLSDVVNMLITKCRSLIIDPKNNLGFTPLMKAALQGRTRCAKLLLFAGASPVETDAGRGFRAEQWARFCGRHTCAETIEQCARARLLDKSTPCGRWSHDINLPVDKASALKARSCSITPQPTQNGFRSKFRKVFPFNFNSSKEKPPNVVGASKESDEHYTKDLVNYLKTATLCVSGPALSANRKIIQSLIRPLEVPKLEVTYANNNALIKKYESAGGNGTAPADHRRDSGSDGSTDSKQSTPQQSPLPTRGKVRH